MKKKMFTFELAPREKSARLRVYIWLLIMGVLILVASGNYLSGFTIMGKIIADVGAWIDEECVTNCLSHKNEFRRAQEYGRARDCLAIAENTSVYWPCTFYSDVQKQELRQAALSCLVTTSSREELFDKLDEFRKFYFFRTPNAQFWLELVQVPELNSYQGFLEIFKRFREDPLLVVSDNGLSQKDLEDIEGALVSRAYEIYGKDSLLNFSFLPYMRSRSSKISLIETTCESFGQTCGGKAELSASVDTPWYFIANHAIMKLSNVDGMSQDKLQFLLTQVSPTPQESDSGWFFTSNTWGNFSELKVLRTTASRIVSGIDNTYELVKFTSTLKPTLELEMIREWYHERHLAQVSDVVVLLHQIKGSMDDVKPTALPLLENLAQLLKTRSIGVVIDTVNDLERDDFSEIVLYQVLEKRKERGKGLSINDATFLFQEVKFLGSRESVKRRELERSILPDLVSRFRNTSPEELLALSHSLSMESKLDIIFSQQGKR